MKSNLGFHPDKTLRLAPTVFFCRPSRALDFFALTHGLRRGLHYYAALRLARSYD